jgi:hypothetical protein
MKRLRVAMATVAAGVLAMTGVGEAASQVCIGFPTARGQAAAAATVGFPTGGSDIGIEAGYHAPAAYAVFGGVTVSRPDVGDNVTSFGAGAAFSVPELRAALPIGLFSCPVVSVVVAQGAGGGDNVISIPVGLGLGTIVPIGPTMTLSPYATPQIRFTDVAGNRGSEFFISGGAILLGFAGPRIYAGGTVNRVFVDQARSVFGLKVGYIF